MTKQQLPLKFLIGKKRLLTLCGSCSAAVGLLMLSLSLTTNNWITTYERQSRSNGTTVVAVNSGLWRKCWRARELAGITKATIWSDRMKEFPDDAEKNCSFISYFKDKSKSTGELKAPEGILYEMRTAAIFPLIGFVVLFVGCAISALSYCDGKLKKCIFVASGFYVLSGVFLLIGIVLYVGSISQAFDIKNNDSDSENQYFFDYGLSFYLSVLSFIFTEFSGVFCIYLYVAKRKHQEKELIIFEEPPRWKGDEAVISCLNFNRHHPWIAVDDHSEVSPTSQNSNQSYPCNRRCSDQMLLKLHHTEATSIQFHPQYCYTSPQHEKLPRFVPGTISKSPFIAKYRADNPSPLLPLTKRESKESITIGTPHVMLYSDDRQIQSLSRPMVTSLVLNKCTYFDSPSMDHPGNNCSNNKQWDTYVHVNHDKPKNNTTLIKNKYQNLSSSTLADIYKPRKITAV